MGLEFDSRAFISLLGRQDVEIARILLDKDTQGSGTLELVEGIVREKRCSYLNLLRSDGASTNPGVHDWLDYFRQEGIPQAVASGTIRRFLREIISISGLQGYFEELISSEDVPTGKPAPDIFLLASARLGVMPRDCVVLEDSALGVSAAKSAGMVCIAVAFTQAKDLLSHADLVIDSFEDVSPGRIFCP